MRGHAHLTLRGRDEGTGVVVDRPLASEVPQERPRGGQLSRRGGARLSVAMQIREETAKRGAIKIRRLEIRRTPAERRGNRFEPLGQVAFVRPYGVNGRVAVEPEELEKGLQLRGHARAAVSALVSIQRASDASAWSASAVLRAARDLGAFGTASMIPNVMFDGS